MGIIKELAERLHRNRVLSAQNLVTVGKSAAESKNKGNSISSREGEVVNAV